MCISLLISRKWEIIKMRFDDHPVLLLYNMWPFYNHWLVFISILFFDKILFIQIEKWKNKIFAFIYIILLVLI